MEKGVSVVDFFADWCGPCKIMHPIYERLSEEYNGKIKFYRLNIDKNEVSTSKYDVMTIPTFIIFKDGEKLDSLVGLVDESLLKEKLNSAI
ncbi:MAG: thioredoxin [Clostridiales Family XIII bacterium]|nr:thioredoxin [Clostridiales Family XIII bacterium]